MLSFIMVAYQFVLLLCDIVQLLCRVVMLYVTALWRMVRPQPLASLAGEVVLVTGAGHGIGKELSLQFARLGCRVICVDINESSNKNTATDIQREGGASWAFQCDVADRHAVKEMAQKVRQQVGEVTILVNNAGIMPCKPFLRHSPDELVNIFRVNVFSQFWTLQEWLPGFISSGRGRVVALSSIAGLVPTANLAPYCASKFAVRGLMEGLTEELRYAARHPNIRLTSVYPFVVDTGLAQRPRIRFPWLNPITTASECAAIIIAGVRRGEEVICVPTRDYYAHWLGNTMPREVRKAILDFMDTGVDED